MLSKNIIIGLVAGEHSGDILGAKLMNKLRKYIPNVCFIGVSGPYMQKEGMETWYSIKELEIFGISEAIMNSFRLIKIRQDLIYRFNKIKPHVFIGIDSPDFNLKIEYNLKKNGISVIHYISPSIWAWRYKRIFKIAQSTNNILVCLPFEKELYDKFNIPCTFIGHALADLIPLYPNKIFARYKLGISIYNKCLVLLPGSRNSEIKMLSKIFLQCACLLKQIFPNLEILIPIINKARRKQFEKIKLKMNLPSFLNLKILENQSHQAMIAADVALLASGTATLECMLAKCPMVVAYKMNSINFLLAKFLIKTSWIALPNLLARKELVKEFIQRKCCSKYILKELIFLLKNENQCVKLKNIFLKIHQQIRCNANEQAANVILNLIQQKNTT